MTLRLTRQVRASAAESSSVFGMDRSHRDRIRRTDPCPASSLGGGTAVTASAARGHNFGRASIHPSDGGPTVQQRLTPSPSQQLQVGPTDAQAEKEADLAASRVAAGGHAGRLSIRSSTSLQRKLKVDSPATAISGGGGGVATPTIGATIEGYLKALCPIASANLAVDPAGGKVTIAPSFCAKKPIEIFGWTTPFEYSSATISGKPASCSCLCDMIDSKHQWTIKVDDVGWPHTDFDDENAANGKKPGGSGGTVFAPSPNTKKLWGAATAPTAAKPSGGTLAIKPWLVLGHELCGHGWLGNFGRHGPDDAKKRGEGGHQATVARENLLRKEHGIEPRGTFKDPNCGESYWQSKAAPAKINWSSYRAVCEKWRKRHYPTYKITDKIP